MNLSTMGKSGNLQQNKLAFNAKNSSSGANQGGVETFVEFLQNMKQGGGSNNCGGNNQRVAQDVSRACQAPLNAQKPLGLDKNRAHAALKNLQNGP